MKKTQVMMWTMTRLQQLDL